MNIRHFEQLSASPAEGLALRTWLELHEKGWVAGVGPHWNDKVVALMDGAECVAFITWAEEKWRAEVRVGLGGTKAASRGFGLYRQVWNALVEHVRAECVWCKSIYSGRHVDNEPSAQMMQALDRPITHVITTYELKR